MMPLLVAVIIRVAQSSDNKHVRTAVLYTFIYKCLRSHDATETSDAL